MAEVLGAAASGAGLLSLGIQLVDCATRLKRFCSNVKDAPKRLRRVTLEIETMSVLLRNLSEDRRLDERSSCMDTRALETCIAICQSAVSQIKDITNTLEDKIRKRRLVGSVLMVIKVDDLKELCQDFDSSRTSLMLAYQMYTEGLRRQDSQVQIERIASLQMVLKASQYTQLPTATDTHTLYTSRPEQTPSGLGKSRHRRTIHGKQAFRVRLPLQSISMVLQLEGMRGTLGFELRFRTYNIVPQDCDIFTCCNLGDLDGMQKLISDGKASPFDQEPDGATLLHACCRGCLEPFQDPTIGIQRIKIVRYLLDSGVDSNARDTEGRRALDHYSRPMYSPPSMTLDVYRLFIEEGDMDTAIGGQSMTAWFLRGDPESMALVKGTLYPPYSSLPQTDRLDFALRATPTADAFLSALETPSIRQSDINLDDRERGVILHYVAEELGRDFSLKASEAVLAGWRVLLKDLLAAGTDPHSPGRDGPQHTPMSTFLSICLHCGISPMVAVMTWATELDVAGIDLLRYGKEEVGLQEAPLSNSPGRMTYAAGRPTCGYEGRFVCRQIVLYKYMYGTRPSDWSVRVRRLVPLWIRRCPPRVPGAWPLEDPYSSQTICWDPDPNEDTAGGEFKFVRWVPLFSDMVEAEEDFVNIRPSPTDECTEDDSMVEGTTGILGSNNPRIERRSSVASSAPLAHETKRTSRASYKYRSLLARTGYAGLVDEFKRDSADISYALELIRSSGTEPC